MPCLYRTLYYYSIESLPASANFLNRTKRGQATFSATALSGTGCFLYFKKLPVPMTGNRKSSQSPPPTHFACGFAALGSSRSTMSLG
jgi:hypothetical protein